MTGRVQYAEKRGLYAGPWAGYMASVEGDWKPYLAGREAWEAAIDRMVDRLPAANRMNGTGSGTSSGRQAQRRRKRRYKQRRPRLRASFEA